MNVSEIVVNIIDARRAFGSDEKVQVVKLERGAPGARKYALSLLLASRARARPAVVAFRNEFLAGRFLAIQDVQGWVLQTAATEGTPTTWANDVPLPASAVNVTECPAELPVWAHNGQDPPVSMPALDQQGRSRVAIKGEIQCTTLGPKYLRYPAKDLTVGSVPMRADGTLYQLHRLATSLAHDFHWTEAEAVMFVLTADVPPVEPAESEIQWSMTPCLSRITIEIDPALSPRQVYELYKRLRSKVLDGRYRNLSQKHTILAGFTATFSELKLADQIREWNRHHSRWVYERVTNFGRDAKKACERLLAPSNLRAKALIGPYTQTHSRWKTE